MPVFHLSSWDTEKINRYWDGLVGALVFDTPDRLGHDLVVWAPGPQCLVNLGPISQSALEEGSGHGFLVRTNRFGDRGELFVRLADGVRATAGLPMEGVRI